MNSKKFYAVIVLRIILISISSVILSFLSFKTNYLYSITLMIILIVIQTWSLIRYILRRRDDIKRMLEYIKENNPTMYFSQSRDYPFNELGSFLNEIGDIVREVRIAKESQLQYMNYIVQHVRTGLLLFDKSGNVEIINQAAKELLGINELNSIDSLEEIRRGLPEVLKNAESDEQKVISFKSADRLLQLSIRTITFKIGQKEIRLASFQDIKNELDEKEMDSWQKLIRVLTHEIINSVTPITALTSTISGFFKKEDEIVTKEDISNENISDTLTGLGYIEDRGKNLISFVTKFRSLTKLPTSKFEEVSLIQLFDNISMLKKEELSAKGIVFRCIKPDVSMNIFCDRSLIEQVLLNLVNNAADAAISKIGDSEKLVEIYSVKGENGHPSIHVRDTGTGISDELAENIFIPFFTTKDNGSGIGLSLSRQIMKLHGGSITVHSKPGVETIFSLKF
jgi:two-component system, NtrC family, nitrogen regulation sensor histidine kinase NtrY